METNGSNTKWVADDLGPAQKSFILDDAVYYEIIAALGVSSHDETDYAVWEHLNFSRMGHARGLKDFFEHSKAWRAKNAKMCGDDVVSEDFGYMAKPIDIPHDDAVRLNKDLFHLTYTRLRHLERPELKPWPHSMLRGIHERCVDFVRHLLSDGLPSEIKAEEPKGENYLVFWRVRGS